MLKFIKVNTSCRVPSEKPEEDKEGEFDYLPEEFKHLVNPHKEPEQEWEWRPARIRVDEIIGYYPLSWVY
jgi:hypothetical protein